MHGLHLLAHAYERKDMLACRHTSFTLHLHWEGTTNGDGWVGIILRRYVSY